LTATGTNNPIVPFLEHQSVMVIDGGLATALEARGCDLDDELWSARVLLEAPDEIRRVHLEFLAAGADCLVTSTYQASFPGLCKRGLDEDKSVELLTLSVRLALEAREEFWSKEENRAGRMRALVAASVGPYGAFLADGSEYTGDYGISDDDLYEFHHSRWQVLAESDADLLACETIPSRAEVGVLLQLLEETPDRWAWLSFSCRDERHLCDGTSFVEVVRACDDHPRIAAVGVNCTSPRFISALITEASGATKKPIIVYPNSGERFIAHDHSWADAPDPIDWGEQALEWKGLGAACIGGCCRVGPREITTMRRQLLKI